ncbi:MAG: PilZ domain-containing protein [Myxococcales bacterium FL481]|nr:MAG: PilZ domain-containing protein [Myxococcales bacterium FL481]
MSHVTGPLALASTPGLSLCDDSASSCTAAESPRAAPESPPPLPTPARSNNFTATRDDGVEYEGDLLTDVIEYRELRALGLRGSLSGSSATRLPYLEQKLRQPSAADDDGAARLRAFYRWCCATQAVVLVPSHSGPARRLEVRIEDMSAGGVKAVADHGFSPGEPVDLRFRVRGGLIEFPSRVAWVRGTAFGMMFAGAARRLAAKARAA